MAVSNAAALNAAAAALPGIRVSMSESEFLGRFD